MPRATWNGFLRLSLVSCPVFLTPATNERSHVRLHQINPKTGNRVRQQLVDAETNEAVGRGDIERGYEYERHQYVIIPDDELQALKIESSQTVDLDRFVRREEIDPVYLDTPYYVYPDGKIASETFQVIGKAMAETGRVDLGSIVLASRERPVLIEPRGTGMLMLTLRSTDEIRADEFGEVGSEPDSDMVAVARTIIERRAARFEPTAFHDRYLDALRELVESKAKGKPAAKKAAETTPPKVIDLMEALQRSLAAGGDKAGGGGRSPRAPMAAPDRRQRHILLPVDGGKPKAARPKSRSAPSRERKQAS